MKLQSSSLLFAACLLMMISTSVLSTPSPLMEWMQCNLCSNIDLNSVGLISDCNCDFTSVNQAVTQFFNPLLREITRTRFFRFFRVDLEKECPFWQEEGTCMMEGCSVCACEEEEVPKHWMSESGHYFPGSGSGGDDNAAGEKAERDTKPSSSSSSLPAGGWISAGARGDTDKHESALIEGPAEYDGDNSKPWRGGGLSPSGGEGRQHGALDSIEKESEEQYFQFLRETENSEQEQDGGQSGLSNVHNAKKQKKQQQPNVGDIFWTDMAEDDCARDGSGDGSDGQCTSPPPSRSSSRSDSSSSSSSSSSSDINSGGSGSQAQGWYVNLLENPEGYTGYSGESPRRVWRAIQEENCFGDVQDQCLEKRVFFRLMSGLQSSISTHVAKEYYFEHSHTWGHNLPLYSRAVGTHKDRLDNLYFAFLFTLRAVVKAGDNLIAYSYDTGHDEDDKEVRALISHLVHSSLPSHLLHAIDTGSASSSTIHNTAPSASASSSSSSSSSSNATEEISEDVSECRSGFDESDLFQVPSGFFGPAYWEKVEEVSQLRESFQQRFQNITRIMDCVSCDKCRVWGKLQILGLGTAIRILLSSEEMLAGPAGVLSRQEVIALINVLHQLSTSVAFASRAAALELDHAIHTAQTRFLAAMAAVVASVLLVPLYRLWAARKGAQRSDADDDDDDDEE